ncbi:unnamed protein product [Phytophthora lilii]|uniref:Unnamed protein product n=1 Tax=Phytophthora lilii TaxID=2077276 RepID=A0A9W6TF47_9STRA|nr:unnamed protein product [Phytophthora lilii]
MNDLATIMQSMGRPKYKGMLSVLKEFRDHAAAAIVPRLVSNNSGGNTVDAEASICFGEEDARVTSSKMFDNEDQTPSIENEPDEDTSKPACLQTSPIVNQASRIIMRLCQLKRRISNFSPQQSLLKTEILARRSNVAKTRASACRT